LKITYRRVGWVRGLVGIKPEVIQGAKANCVGILILGKRFRSPSDRTSVLGNSPRSTAISSISLGAIVGPTGMLRRCMKIDVRNVYSGSNRHAERLDRAIEVLVIERIFIVPHASAGVRDFVAHEPNTIIAVIRFDLVYCRTGPSRDCRLRSHRRS